MASDPNQSPGQDEGTVNAHYVEGGPTERSGKGSRTPPPASGNLVDPWTFLGMLTRRWYWLLLSGLLFGGACGYLGWHMWKPSYSATAELIRVESEHLTEFFKPRDFTDQTFGSLLRTPELLKRVGSQLQPPVPPNELGSLLQIVPVPESAIVRITAYGTEAKEVVHLANLYATNAVEYTRELQRIEAGQVNEALKQQFARTDKDIADLKSQLRSAPPPAAFQPNTRLTQLYERLNLARTELLVLQSKYTDIHPEVKSKAAEVAELEKQVQQTEQPSDTASAPGFRRELDGTLPPVTGTQPPRARVTTDAFDSSQEYLRNQLYAISASQLTLAARQRDAEVGSSRVDLQACKLEYSIVSPK